MNRLLSTSIHILTPSLLVRPFTLSLGLCAILAASVKWFPWKRCQCVRFPLRGNTNHTHTAIICIFICTTFRLRSFIHHRRTTKPHTHSLMNKFECNDSQLTNNILILPGNLYSFSSSHTYSVSFSSVFVFSLFWLMNFRFVHRIKQQQKSRQFFCDKTCNNFNLRKWMETE